MPEKILTCGFDLKKFSIGRPVKVTIYGTQFQSATWGYIIAAFSGFIVVGAFDEENVPTTCKITKRHILEEVATIEILG